MNNQGWFLTAKHTFELRDIDMPVLLDDQILVEQEYVGICGSDLHYYDDPDTPPIKGYKIPLPIMLGHECAGVVTKVGKNVRSLSVGDLVAIEPGVPCGICEMCKSGRYNLCPHLVFMAAPPFQTGAMCKYLSHPAHMAYKLPQNVSSLEGALIEPLAVGLHAAQLGGVGLGDTVLILGAGCIGLTVLLACKARGATKIIVADIFENRLEKALELGATAIVNSSRENVADQVRELLGGLPGFVFEAAGNPVTTAQSIQLVCRGGTIVIVGVPFGDVPFEFSLASAKEARIVPVFRYRNIYPKALEAVSGGKLDIRSIATHQFGFADVPEAFRQALTNKKDIVKAVINFK